MLDQDDKIQEQLARIKKDTQADILNLRKELQKAMEFGVDPITHRSLGS